MDIFDSKYYANAKFLLEILGLWPYQSTIRRWISLFVYYLISLSLTVPMVFYLILNNPSIYIWAENLILIFYTLISLVKYTVTFASVSELKILFSQIKNDWRRIKNEEELGILKKLAEESRLISLIIMIYMYPATSIFCGSSIASHILENVFPLNNGSYPQLYPANSEFLFFEQSDHYLLTCVHLLIVFMSEVTMYIATDVIYLCTVQHAAALFSIVSHKLENVFNSDDTDVNMDNLKEAVELFNDSVRCCDSLEDAFSICLFVEFVACSLGIAGCSVIILTMKEIFAIVKMMAVLIGAILHVLFSNWVGQKIIDTSEKLFNSAYFSNWYQKPPKIQKLIIIVMCRTLKPQELTAGKVIILSMYTFGQLMRSCSSIFTAFSWIATKSG